MDIFEREDWEALTTKPAIYYQICQDYYYPKPDDLYNKMLRI